jgi:hypothetical protein
MLGWSLHTIRTRLATMLRHADAAELADRIERDGIDLSPLDGVEDAVATWEPSHAVEMLEEAREWYKRWKTLHPQFNTQS